MNTLVVTHNPRPQRDDSLREVRPFQPLNGFAASRVIVNAAEPLGAGAAYGERFVHWFRDVVMTRTTPGARYDLPAWLVEELQR